MYCKASSSSSSIYNCICGWFMNCATNVKEFLPELFLPQIAYSDQFPTYEFQNWFEKLPYHRWKIQHAIIKITRLAYVIWTQKMHCISEIKSGVNCSKIIDQSDVKKYRRREYFKSTGENISQWPYVLTEDSTDRQNSVGEFYNINQRILSSQLDTLLYSSSCILKCQVSWISM